MVGDLREGLTDGKYKKVVNNRANAELTTQHARDDLKDTWYGIHEQPAKEDQFGRIVGTPNYLATAHPEESV